MKIFFTQLLVFVFVIFSSVVSAQTTVYCSATGNTNSYTTGYATSQARYDNNILVSAGSAINPVIDRGYAVFNLASLSIPSTATITSVTLTLHFTYSGSTGLNANVHGITSNLSSVTSASTLYSDIASGTSLYSYQAFGTSSPLTLSSNTALVSFIQANYNSTITIGLFDSTTILTSNVGTYTITGETGTGGSATATAPTLAITYSNTCTPTIAISANTGDTICSGTSVTFSSTITNGGSSPTYQWKKNGTAISGATSSTYTTSTISNGDVFGCVLTSNASCATTTTTANSNNDTMTVISSGTPTITISASPGDTICAFDSVTFSSATTYAGSPSYQWKRNGAAINGATSSTYIAHVGGVYTCVLTSSLSCASPSTATSNSITITVKPNVTPTINISCSPASATMCSWDSATFSSSITNGGTAPTYHWKENAIAIAGATSSMYVAHSSANYTCVLISNASCAYPDTVTSNIITLTIMPSLAPSISISATPGNTICQGELDTFTVTNVVNGGNGPTYQWYKNGTVISAATATTYIAAGIANGNSFYCLLTSNQYCASPDPVASDTISITVNNNVTPLVSISASPGTTVSAGTLVTFTASPTFGGSSPVYQWYKNGVAISGATFGSYQSSTLNNGDIVSVNMLSNRACVVPDSAVSNSDTMHVTTGVNQLTGYTEVVSIYPNPTNGTFAVYVPASGVLHLYSVLGQEVYEMSVSQSNPKINLPAGLAKGMYIGKFVSDKGNITGMFRLVYN